MKRTPLERKTPLKRKSPLPRIYFKRRKSATLDALYDKDIEVQQIAATKQCEHCGSRYKVVGHHLIPRKFLKYRHHTANIMPLCADCHVPWAHGHPAEFDEWFHQELTQWAEWVDENRARANQGMGPKPEEGAA